MSRLLADLKKAVSRQADKVPKRFKTMRQLAEAEGHDESWAKRAMKTLLTAGTWEEKTFRVVTERCGLRPVPHYAPK